MALSQKLKSHLTWSTLTMCTEQILEFLVNQDEPRSSCFIAKGLGLSELKVISALGKLFDKVDRTFDSKGNLLFHIAKRVLPRTPMEEAAQRVAASKTRMSIARPNDGGRYLSLKRGLEEGLVVNASQNTPLGLSFALHRIERERRT